MGKAIKLNIEPQFDFILIGLVTSEPVYRVSWLINERLDIQLKEVQALLSYHNKRQVYQEFSVFQYINDDEEIFQLIQNKSSQGLLIEEQKQVDFWLKIENAALLVNDYLKLIKPEKNISLAFEVKPGSLKSGFRLILSDENS